MNSSLFQIEQSMMYLLEYGIDDSTGEILETEEEFRNKYNEIQLDIQTKLDNTNCLMKLIDGDLEVINKEIERLQAYKKERENKKKWLFNMVDSFIRRQCLKEDGTLDVDKLHSTKMRLPHSYISYRKSEKVNVLDADKLPSEFVTVKTETKPNLTEIKKAIKNGADFSGVAELTTNLNMQIK